jgi:sporulation protein YlmC with PRC-barrel domain
VEKKPKLLDIALRSTAVCEDGSKGRISRLAVEPDSKQITHVIVRYGRTHQQVSVPVALVARAQAYSLDLTLSKAELEQLPRFIEVDYALPMPEGRPSRGSATRARQYTAGGIPPAGATASRFDVGRMHRGIPSEDVPIGRGTRITCFDGRIGRLNHVIVDPQTDHVMALIVRTGHLHGKDVVISAGRIAWIGENEIHVDVDRASVPVLPEYSPAAIDEYITSQVELQSATHEKTGSEPSTATHQVDAAPLPQVALSDAERPAMTERASTGAHAEMIEMPDGWDLVRTISDVLAHNARTARAVVDVNYNDGSVILRGHVSGMQEKLAVVESARSVQGVGALIDETEIQADRHQVPMPTSSQLSALAVAVRPGRFG